MLDADRLGARVREGVGGSARVEVVPRSASTSSDLAAAVQAAPHEWPDRSVLVADHQEAGRGRRGRTWTTPPGTSVTLSVLLRPGVPEDRWAWLTLLAGAATADAVERLTGLPTALKWPNDVLVLDAGADDVPGWGTARKVAGVLGEVVATPDGPVAVVGVGVNVAQRADELPVPWATSLAVSRGEGTAVPTREDVAVEVVRALVGLEERWRAADGDARESGLAARCSDACVTLGGAVRVELPGDRVLEGTARSLAPDGALEVVDRTGVVHAVLAGDVHHVREVR